MHALSKMWATKSSVVDSRQAEGNTIRRRREVMSVSIVLQPMNE